MCQEVFLAAIYFVIICLANILFLKLVMNLVQRFLLFTKMKKILKTFPSSFSSLLICFYFLLDESAKVNYSLVKNYVSSEDLLIVGNFYDFLVKRKKGENRVFFALLKDQYFP
jgi:hypothetical protein